MRRLPGGGGIWTGPRQMHRTVLIEKEQASFPGFLRKQKVSLKQERRWLGRFKTVSIPVEILATN